MPYVYFSHRHYSVKIKNKKHIFMYVIERCQMSEQINSSPSETNHAWGILFLLTPKAWRSFILQKHNCKINPIFFSLLSWAKLIMKEFIQLRLVRCPFRGAGTTYFIGRLCCCCRTSGCYLRAAHCVFLNQLLSLFYLLHMSHCSSLIPTWTYMDKCSSKALELRSKTVTRAKSVRQQHIKEVLEKTIGWETTFKWPLSCNCTI